MRVCRLNAVDFIAAGRLQGGGGAFTRVLDYPPRVLILFSQYKSNLYNSFYMLFVIFVTPFLTNHASARSAMSP